MTAVVRDYNDFTDIDVTDNGAAKMENIKEEVLEIEEHSLELYEVEKSTQNLDDSDEEWLT